MAPSIAATTGATSSGAEAEQPASASASASASAPASTQLSQEQMFEMYRQSLNYRVLQRYDPKLKEIYYTASHCVLYQFNESTQEWEKLEQQGVMIIYSRYFQLAVPDSIGGYNEDVFDTYQDDDELQKEKEKAKHQEEDRVFSPYADPYAYGIIIFNRLSPENFCIGVSPNSVAKADGLELMDVSLSDEIILVRTATGKTYGLWLFDKKDREPVRELLDYLIVNDPPDLMPPK